MEHRPKSILDQLNVLVTVCTEGMKFYEVAHQLHLNASAFWKNENKFPSKRHHQIETIFGKIWKTMQCKNDYIVTLSRRNRFLRSHRINILVINVIEAQIRTCTFDQDVQTTSCPDSGHCPCVTVTLTREHRRVRLDISMSSTDKMTRKLKFF